MVFLVDDSHPLVVYCEPRAIQQHREDQHFLTAVGVHCGGSHIATEVLTRPEGLASLAVGETVILLHPPVHVVGFSIWMQRECQQNTVSPWLGQPGASGLDAPLLQIGPIFASCVSAVHGRPQQNRSESR